MSWLGHSPKIRETYLSILIYIIYERNCPTAKRANYNSIKITLNRCRYITFKSACLALACDITAADWIC